MIMKYPTLDTFDPSVDATKLKTEQLFDIIANTVYEVYDGETVHKAADYTKEEMKKFIESLTSEHFQKIQQLELEGYLFYLIFFLQVSKIYIPKDYN